MSSGSGLESNNMHKKIKLGWFQKKAVNFKEYKLPHFWDKFTSVRGAVDRRVIITPELGVNFTPTLENFPLWEANT